MSDCFDLIERRLLAGPWVLGETYSFCDPYLFTIAGWLEGAGLDIARWPKTAEHSRRMADDPAVRRVLAAHTAPL
jgi:glutathione S-transferase